MVYVMMLVLFLASLQYAQQPYDIPCLGTLSLVPLFAAQRGKATHLPLARFCSLAVACTILHDSIVKVVLKTLLCSGKATSGAENGHAVSPRSTCRSNPV